MRRLFRDPAAWPLTLKVPMLVALLTVLVAIVLSNVVLRRLASDQEANLRQLAGAYLDGLSTAVIPEVIRGDIWETFDILDRSRALYSGLQARYAVVAKGDGSVLAASDPRRFPVHSKLPQTLTERFGADDLRIDEEAGLAWARRTLRQEGIELGSILAEIDIAPLLAVRREVLLTLVLVNGALALAFATAGYLTVRRMMRPLGLLRDHVERARDGRVVAIPARHLGDEATEFGRLFASFNAMAAALREREALAARLAEEERIAQLGKLASGMAHEVNNPLGGMLNLVDTLRKHGDDPAVRRRSLDLLERGLIGIRNVVRATLATYKGETAPERLSGRGLDDLRFLVQHEVNRRALRLDWRNGVAGEIDLDGSAVRQIALNLLLNACAAAPEGGCVGFAARLEGAALRIEVSDSGPGLPEAVRALYERPALASHPPPGGVGLGVWTVCLLVSRLRGTIRSGRSAAGTMLAVTLPLGRQEPLDAVA